MQRVASVRVTAFGDGRFEVPLVGGSETVADVLRANRIETAGRRLAVNGHAAELGTGVLEGDEVTLIPRVHGG
jgi:molybdopterin converting factor small subunit